MGRKSPYRSASSDGSASSEANFTHWSPPNSGDHRQSAGSLQAVVWFSENIGMQFVIRKHSQRSVRMDLYGGVFSQHDKKPNFLWVLARTWPNRQNDGDGVDWIELSEKGRHYISNGICKLCGRLLWMNQRNPPSFEINTQIAFTDNWEQQKGREMLSTFANNTVKRERRSFCISF